jgi:hypothetical protein
MKSIIRLVSVVLLLTPMAAQAQSTYTANIHNAPGWTHSTSYTYHAGPPNNHKTRVNNGAAWNEVSYTSGLALNAYELLDPGGGEGSTCTSAASGGPSGTGSNITDNTCHWKYLSGVDYISMTGWANDNGVVWSSGTDYVYWNVVQTGSNLSAYRQLAAGCHSTVQPTTSGATSDGCYWNYLGDILYTSAAHPLPVEQLTSHDKFTGSISGTTLTVTTPPATLPLAVNLRISAPGLPAYYPADTVIISGSGTSWQLSQSISTPFTGSIFIADILPVVTGLNDLYTAIVWNDREYVGGSNGEAQIITFDGHNAGHDRFGYADNINISPMNTAAAYGFPIIVKAAPGDSFVDTMNANPSLALAGYNANYGVGFRGSAYPFPAISVMDNSMIFDGIQAKSGESTGSSQAAALSGDDHGFSVSVVKNSIIDGGGGSPSALRFGFQSSVINSLIVARGVSGVSFVYGGSSYNNTIVCPSGTCTGAAIEHMKNWVTYWGVTMSGNAMFGFAHLVSTAQVPGCGGDCSTVHGLNNATDVAASDGSTWPAVTYTGGNIGSLSYVLQFRTGAQWCGTLDARGNVIPGTCGIANSLSPSGAFVSWPGNYKISNTSVLYGAGASYGTFNWCGVTRPPQPPPFTTWSGCTITPDTPDMFGTARPQAEGYDIGAVQVNGGMGPAAPYGGRLLLR